MIKQILFLIAASIASLFFKNELAQGVHFLIYGHHQLASFLSGIFSSDETGHIIQGVLALIFIPFALGGAIAFVYWLVRKKSMPHTLTVIWVIWAVLVAALLVQSGAMTGTAG